MGRPSYNISKILEILKSSYFAKIMTRKPKIGNLTNMTKLCPFWSHKSGICYLRGFCGDMTSHENQEYLNKVD